jgi:hypothetical protein
MGMLLLIYSIGARGQIPFLLEVQQAPKYSARVITVMLLSMIESGAGTVACDIEAREPCVATSVEVARQSRQCFRCGPCIGGEPGMPPGRLFLRCSSQATILAAADLNTYWASPAKGMIAQDNAVETSSVRCVLSAEEAVCAEGGR